MKTRSAPSTLWKYPEGKRGGQNKQQNAENPKPGGQLPTPEKAWGSSREDGPFPSPTAAKELWRQLLRPSQVLLVGSGPDTPLLAGTVASAAAATGQGKRGFL